MKTRLLAILSAVSMVASLLVVAPVPAAAQGAPVIVTTLDELLDALGTGEFDIQIDGPIAVDGDVTIEGSGPTAEATTLTVISNSPALEITSGTVNLRMLAITGANDRKASGGAVSVQEGAVVHMRYVSVYDNFAGEGGGLYNAGTTHVYDSVFYANESFGKGGAINNAGTLEVWNSTFASNDAGQGGAISSSGVAELHFVTIVGNSSKNKIGAGTHLNGGSILLDHSIVANNYSGGSFYDCSGQTTTTFTLFSSIQGCQPGPDYLVAPDIYFEKYESGGPSDPFNAYHGREFPFDNGGPTMTVAIIDPQPEPPVGPGNGHPAVGYGNSCADPGFDQRGVSRPSTGCTVGAFEPDPADINIPIFRTLGEDGLTPVSSVSIGAVTASLDDINAGVRTLAQQGTSVSASPFSSIPFSSIDLDDAPFSSIPFSSINVGGVPFSSIPFSSIGPTGVPFSSIPFSSIPYSSITISIPFSSIPFSSIAVDGTPFSSIPFSSIPFSSIPFSSIAASVTPFSSIDLDDILLSELTAYDGHSMDLYTQYIPDLADTPLQALSLGDLVSTPFSSITLTDSPFSSIPFSSIPFSSIAGGIESLVDCDGFLSEYGITCGDYSIDPYATTPTLSELDSANLLLGTPTVLTFGDLLGLDDINVNSTPFSSIPFSSIALGTVPVEQIPLSLDTGELDVDAWCALLGDQTCADFGIDAEPTTAGPSLLTLALGGVDLDVVPFSSIGLTGLDLSSTPIGLIPFSSINLPLTPLGLATNDSTETPGLPPEICDYSNSVGYLCTSPDATFLSALNAGALLLESPGDATIADLEGWEGLEGYSLADLLLGLIGPSEIPWLEVGDLNSIRLPDADSTPQPYFIYETVLDIQNRDATIDVTLELPVGFVPASDVPVTLDGEEIGFGTESQDSSEGVTNPPITLTFTDLPLLRGQHTLHVPVRAGLVLELEGSANTEATVVGIITSESPTDPPTASKTVSIGVDEGIRSSTLPLIAGSGCSLDSNLEIAHITDVDDAEVYSFTVPTDCGGARLELLMTNLAADLDVVLFGPTATSYLRGTPTSSSPYVEDHQYDLNPDDGSLDTEVLRDINIDAEILLGVTGYAPVAVSARRGLADEFIEARVATGNTYYVVVSGYNGASTNQPFAIQARLRGFALDTSGSMVEGWVPPIDVTLPPEDPAATTLYLYNEGWWTQNTELSELLGGIHGTRLPNQDGEPQFPYVAVPVDRDSAVRQALQAWYGVNGTTQQAGPEGANDVVRAIGNLIDNYNSAGNLQYVVLIGDDREIPFARVVDNTTYSNETDHAPSITESGELRSALGGGYILSDDPYASEAGIAIADTEFFVPARSVGRLVETHEQILDQLTAFDESNGVLAEPGLDAYAAAAGYDFLGDGVEEIIDYLILGGYSGLDDAVDVETLGARVLNERGGPGDLWTNENLAALIGVSGTWSGAENTVVSVNAHFDQNRALPSEGNATGDESTDLFTVDSLIDPSGLALITDAVLFSMGCHSGLSVSNALFDTFDPVDWAERFADLGNLWIGNTGYGYGDSDLVAYSEELSAGFAGFVGFNTIGEAWKLAKQDFASGLFVVSPYHTKSLNEWVLYGLPMYYTHDGARSRQTASAASAAVLTGPGAIPAPGAEPLQFAPFALTSGEIDLNREPNGEAGDFYTANGGVLAVRGFAPVAIAEQDVTITDLEAAGVFVTGLTSTEETEFSAKIVNPIVDQGDGAPGNAANPNVLTFPLPDSTFPAGIARLMDSVDGDGTPITLAQFAASRFDPDPQENGATGTMETFTDFDFTVFYRDPGSSDTSPPLITLVEGVSDGIIAYFEVTLKGDDYPDRVDDVYRANVLFGPSSRAGAEWTAVELSRVAESDLWVGGVAIDPLYQAPGENFAFWVQACDLTGNCGSSTAKGKNFLTEDTSVLNGVNLQVISGTPGDNGWYTSDVMVQASTTSGVVSKITVDAEPVLPLPVDLTVTITEAGGHFIVAEGTETDPGALLVAIDPEDPVVSSSVVANNPAIDLDPTVNTTNGYVDGAGATATFSATDETSGVRSLKVASNDYTGPIEVFQTSVLSYTATDFAGRTHIGTVPIDVDATPPVVQDNAPIGWIATSPLNVSFTVTEDESGLASLVCTTDGTDPEIYGTDCGTGLTFSGPTNVTVEWAATDNVGNVQTGSFPVQIDTTGPTTSALFNEVSWPQPDPSLGFDAPATATYSCDDPESGIDPDTPCTAVINYPDGTVIPFAGGTLPTGLLGTYTIDVTARNKAGLSVSDSYSYDVADNQDPIPLLTPPSGTYLVGETAVVAFSCSDDVAVWSCTAILTDSDGSVLDTVEGSAVDGIYSGSVSIPTSDQGEYKITVNAIDTASNEASASGSYFVQYNVCLLYDPDNAQPHNGAVAVKLQLCDSAGTNLSKRNITVTATYLEFPDGTTKIPEPDDSGNSNSPSSNFRFDQRLDGYIYNLNEDPGLLNSQADGESYWFLHFEVDGFGDYGAKFTLK